MTLPNYLETARKKINDIVHLRSNGSPGVEVAGRLGLAPWQVYALTRFVKVLVTTDEKVYLEGQAERYGFGSIGEYVMDVFHRYESYYGRKATVINSEVGEKPKPPTAAKNGK